MDPDPEGPKTCGSGSATLMHRMELSASSAGMNILDLLFENPSCQFFGLKIHNFFDADPDAGSC